LVGGKLTEWPKYLKLDAIPLLSELIGWRIKKVFPEPPAPR
jgi:hypothetical protein